MSETILILGSCGQIGTELAQKLRNLYGANRVIASDVRTGNPKIMNSGPFEILDATDAEAILRVVRKYRVSQVYIMSAMVSVLAEKYPQKAWNLNMTSLLSVLNLSKEKYIKQVFWPSSIAVFGETSPKINTPQHTITEPSTVYGISKIAGEYWCDYYHRKFGVDVRSIRYPGIISWKVEPGGGTTDYAVDIYVKAIEDGHFDCFLNADTRLPMMYIDDAIEATVQIMNSEQKNIKIRKSYNVSAIDFTPEEIAAQIKKHIPNFTIGYKPDFRQSIADSWPNSIDDSKARQDWGWNHKFDLCSMTEDILKNLKSKKHTK